MKLRKFDTKVQHLKYKVLKEVAKNAFEGTLNEALFDIQKTIVPGKKPSMRCCVYKERAIVNERVKLAMGGDKNNPNVIEVIEIACDECPVSGYEVSAACRGCLAHRCEDVCPRGAISFNDRHEAHIDKEKCIQCGRCAKVCPYNAIINHKRPCMNACKVGAISISEEDCAKIDNNKCTSCGACVYQCPFGAISDKSFILDAIEILKGAKRGEHKAVAVIAPSIGSQFNYATTPQVMAGLIELGFTEITEAALGADIVAMAEAEELREKGFMTSSCCPAFVSFIKHDFPQLEQYISSNPSPAAAISKYVKQQDPGCKIVFVGPCTAKKMEFQRDDVKDYIDCVITFEELQALFDSRDIDITSLKGYVIDEASSIGRRFARSCGVSEAVAEAFKEMGVTDFEAKPIACSGMEECKMALLKASKKVLPENFIEGMACIGGCVGGAGCLTHAEKNRVAVEKYSETSSEKTITGAIEKSIKDFE